MYGFRFMGAIVAQIVCHRKVNCANDGSGIAAPTACDMKGIADQPQILEALSPSYALEFLFGHFSIAFFSLAAVGLAVTGAEALYADMGHFDRGPITRA